MSRFKLTLEYAGTRYSGWQVQKNARTVQGELDRAVREAAGAPSSSCTAPGVPTQESTRSDRSRTSTSERTCRRQRCSDA
jgi:tRNA pseudouridine(38-40) synthase